MTMIKRACSFFLVLIVAFSILPPHSVTGHLATQDGQSSLTVVQWNVYYGKGTDEVYNLERQVDTIASASPDVVMLNEVLPDEAAQYRQLLTSRTEELWYAHHVRAQPDGTGNLILSRHGFASVNSYRMQQNGQYSRAVAQASININGVDISLFSTHLDHNNESIRLAQIREYREFASHFPKPHILAGDFNASPGTREMKKLKKGYIDAWEHALSLDSATSYDDNPVDLGTRTHRERIDYILYSKKPKKLILQQTQIPDLRDLTNTSVRKRLGTPDDLGVRPSDHNLIVATFRVRM